MLVEGIEAYNVFAYITAEDHQGLLNYLKFQKNNLDLMSMKDSRDFTVLTYSAYRNNTNCFKILFEYAWNKSFGRNRESFEKNKVRKF